MVSPMRIPFFLSNDFFMTSLRSALSSSLSSFCFSTFELFPFSFPSYCAEIRLLSPAIRTINIKIFFRVFILNLWFKGQSSPRRYPKKLSNN